MHEEHREKMKENVNFNVISLKDGIRRVINGTLWTLCSILVPFVVKNNVNNWLSYYCILNPTLQKQGYVAPTKKLLYKMKISIT